MTIVYFFALRDWGYAKEVAEEEGHIGGAFGQAAHEVGEPVVAEGDVDAHAVAVADELALQIGAHAIEHLKFEVVLGDLFGGGEANGGTDHARVVRGNGVIEAAGQEQLHQADVVGVNVGLFGIGNFSGFLIGALAQANAATVGEQVADVGFACGRERIARPCRWRDCVRGRV